jgi:hypothetical protein
VKSTPRRDSYLRLKLKKKVGWVAVARNVELESGFQFEQRMFALRIWVRGGKKCQGAADSRKEEGEWALT